MTIDDRNIQSRDLKIPHSLEAEKAALGCAMMDPALGALITSILKSEEFFYPAHRIIFEAILWLANHNVPADVVTVIDRLSGEELLNGVGGPAYAAGLTGIVPTLANAERYCEIIKEKARLRRIQQMGREAVGFIDNESKRSSQELTDHFMSELIANADYGDDFLADDISKSIYENEKYFQEIKDKKRKPPVRLGFPLMDEIVMLFEGELLTIGARPSQGKTALAVGIALNNIALGNKVLFISAEMDRRELAHRFIAGVAGINITLLRKGAVTDLDTHPRVKWLLKRKHLLKIACPASLNEMDVKRIIKRETLQSGKPDLFMIDYIQRMKCSRRVRDRKEEVAAIANSIFDMCREIQIAGVMMSQLSRPTGKDKQAPKPPTMFDLKEAGEIEAVSHVIVLVHRLDNDKTMPQWDYDLLVEKNRNGPLGDVRFEFDRATAKFRESELQASRPPTDE